MARRFPELTSPEENIFAAILGVIEADPVLNALPLWVYDLSGRYDDLEPGGVPPEAKLPAVGVGFGSNPSGWESNKYQRCAMTVELQCFSPGTHRGDLLGIQHRLYQVLFNQQVLYATDESSRVVEWNMAPRIERVMGDHLMGTQFALVEYFKDAPVRK